MKHRISAVEDESISSELGVVPGDLLLTIDGKTIIDVLDYRFRLHAENIVVEIEKPDGEIWELDIEKDENEDIGLIFEIPLMSDVKLCKNNCVFCFVDQEPPGLRKTLYVKDDDWRLSFLHGNFVTLTNLSDEEVGRIAELHLPELNISVHSTDLDLRKSMMGTQSAGNLFQHIRTLSNAGIAMNFQIVLCKGINDGKILESTVLTLEKMAVAKSLAVVPVGLTKFRDGLTPLDSFLPDEAAVIISQIEKMQHQFIKKRKSSFVFLSDEWYIMAGFNLPSLNKYESFLQLSNGVGMIRLFEHDFINRLKQLPKSDNDKFMTVISGALANSFIRSLVADFCNKFKNAKITVIEVKNFFYGETVTVSGLLTGEDILSQYKKSCQNESSLFLPGNAFRINSEEMIDGLTRSQLEKNLDVCVIIGSQNGGDFCGQLYKELIC